MGAYSFLNVEATFAGPGGNFQIGSSAGVAKEGISTSFDEPKGTVTTGADGSIMGSLHAGQTGKMTIRLLKTSPVNAQLSASYAFQRQSAANWQQNIIRVVDKVRGDLAVIRQANFMKFPDNAWSEDGNVLTWEFQGILTEDLGAGVPDLSNP
jgi:Bacteriophage KPP10, Structural protein ORF10